MTDNQLLVDTSDVVHIDNEETIIGTKTFSRDTVVKNLSPMMTNCITDIPQDIKLTLSNGTLALKSGSNIYYPNGSGVFTKVTTSTDYTVSVGSPTGNRVLLPIVNSAGTSFSFLTAQNGLNLFSGATAPTVTVSTAYWYDTTNNIIKRTQDTGATWSTISGAYICLPICLTTFSNGSVTSIDQIFNGFGYIGSTVFALPGVKGLIPNGRNADGTLKSTEFVLNSVKTQQVSYVGYICVDSTGIGIFGQSVTEYQEDKNLNFDIYAGSYFYRCICGIVYYSSNSITSMDTKTPFHALDWNDKSTIAGFSMPSNKYINLTLGASGSTYTAPANGWFYFAKIASASNQYMTMYVNNSDPPIFATTTTQPIDGGQARLFLPVKKGDIVGVSYNLGGETRRFCFIYAEGEV